MFAASKTAGASGGINYIEDVFSTWLYTGTGATRSITNGIDLSTKGGLVWIKNRGGVNYHVLTNTISGVNKQLATNDSVGEFNETDNVTSFNTTGFTLGADVSNAWVNGSGKSYASWTFREQPKFFDIVTWSGSGANRTISHLLGSVPGCIFVKRTDSTGGAWQVYHRSLANTEYLVLNTTAAKATGATRWNSTTPTSSVFSVGTDATVNASGGTYIAFIFAHDAGGFGLTNTDNVISCGSFTTDADALATVTLGYEPQWLLAKNSNGAENWFLVDNMRGLNLTNTARLFPNTSGAESAAGVPVFSPTSTGFTCPTIGNLTANQTYIYIAIRRGPMKVPTTGTSVFGMSARSGTGANATVTGGQTDDAVLIKNRGSAVASLFSSRLTGTRYLVTSSNAAEVAAGATILQSNPWDVMDGVKVGTTSTITNASGSTFINYLFKRAPSFFDEVCYTGTGSNSTLAHNLAAVPELMIVKKRSATDDWWVMGLFTPTTHGYGNLNLTDNWSLNQTYAAAGLLTGQPTSTSFTVSSSSGVLTASGATYVAYLFATCAGVSKVGSYTGNGTTQTINCEITAGARFVLIKRTDSTGDWYVYDTARGMTALTDPYWLANSTAAEAATLGSVTTVSTGFAVNASVLAAINTNAATYIFLAIA
jgi:hypothetical protein